MLIDPFAADSQVSRGGKRCGGHQLSTRFVAAIGCLGERSCYHGGQFRRPHPFPVQQHLGAQYHELHFPLAGHRTELMRGADPTRHFAGGDEVEPGRGDRPSFSFAGATGPWCEYSVDQNDDGVRRVQSQRENRTIGPRVAGEMVHLRHHPHSVEDVLRVLAHVDVPASRRTAA